jgi:hypothetical protein
VPKILYRLWLYIFFAVLAAIFIAFCIRITYGANLLGSFVNSETSIGFWIKQGLDFRIVLAIAICCSSYNIFGWFLLFSWLRLVEPEKIEHRWRLGLYRRLCWLGGKLGHVYVPNPTDAGIDVDGQPSDRKYYALLLLFGAYPGLIQIGVNYALNFRLKERYAFFLLAGADAVKLCFFTLLNLALAVRINPILPVLLCILLAHYFKRQIEKKISAWSAETKPAFPLLVPKLDEET